MSDHLIAEANRHAKALRKMSLPTTQPTQRDIQWYIEECIDLRKQLDLECASKREHLRIACDEINKLKVQVGIYERENAALRNFYLAGRDINDSVIRFIDCYDRLNSDLPVVMKQLEQVRRDLQKWDSARKEAQP